MSLTIATVNVNGIRAACKKRNDDNLGMNEWLRHTPADVVLFQEVRATPQQAEKALAPALDNGWCMVVADAVEDGMKGRAGVGILSRTPIDDVAVGFNSDVTRFADSGRWIEATTGGIRVASLYLPSGDEGTKKLDDKYAFLDEFGDVLAARAEAYPDMVIGGDWNI